MSEDYWPEVPAPMLREIRRLDAWTIPPAQMPQDGSGLSEDPNRGSTASDSDPAGNDGP